MTSRNLENLINESNEFINIDKDRAEYDKLFSSLRDIIISNLQKDFLFKKLYGDWRLEGSYGDNLKVNKPDEFDLVFILEFPKFEKLIVEPSKPGFVTINIEDVLKSLGNDKQEINMAYTFRTWSTNSNMLKVAAIQSWLKGLFSKVLKRLMYKLIINGTEYTLIYQQMGPAHTITVALKQHSIFSVDFVPGIKLQLNDDMGYDFKTYEVIPKPDKLAPSEYMDFRRSFYRQEAVEMQDKMNFKNALRFMKKFRDSHPNMANLKSYYIKTLFLWKNNQHKKHSEYWHQQLSSIIIDMFTELENCLRKQKLLFYWDDKCNLLSDYQPSQIHAMLQCVTTSRSILISQEYKLQHPDKVLRIFLTHREINSFRPKQIKQQSHRRHKILRKSDSNLETMPKKLKIEINGVAKGQPLYCQG